MRFSIKDLVWATALLAVLLWAGREHQRRQAVISLLQDQSQLYTWTSEAYGTRYYMVLDIHGEESMARFWQTLDNDWHGATKRGLPPCIK